jgi:hypothetical protein
MKSEEKDKVEEVHIARQAAYRLFKEKWDQMQDNSGFLRLNQYSATQLQKMSEQKRVPYVLDQINSAVNTYQGIQRDRRTEIFYYPVEDSDSVACEVLNAVKDATLAQSNFVYTESDVFTDGLIQKVGAVAYEWSREKDKNGALKIMKLRPRELMWDLNAQEYDKSDAMWMSRYRMFGRDELINRFPWLRKQIENMAFFTGQEAVDLGLYGEYLESLSDQDNKWVALIEYFKKVYESRYFIQNVVSGYIDTAYYEDKKSAEKEIEKRLAQYQEEIANQAPQMGQMPPPPPQFEIFKDTTPVIKKITICHDTLFKTEDGSLEETLEEPFYPIDIYHPFWHDSDWWCPVDVMKDGQRFFNKMFSMADHWIGTMAKGTLIGQSTDPEEEKKVRDTFSSTGGFAHVKDVENYKMFESRGPNPQLFTMMDMARQNLVDNAGGQNFAGRKETASESGVAVRQRIEQGGLSGFIIYDNLRRWKMSVGAKMAWYLTHYMTVPQVVRIEGEELVQQTFDTMQKSESSKDWFKANPMRPGIGFLKVNTNPMNSLEGLKVDVNVDEARWSVSKSAAILADINAAMQSNPLLAQTFPPEIILEYLPLEFSAKEKARVLIKKNEEMRANLEQVKATKPPAVSLDLGDVSKLSPEIQVQMLQKFYGIQADPSQMVDMEQQKTQAELQMKGQSHQMDMQTKMQGAELEAQKKMMGLEHQKQKNQIDLEKQQDGIGMARLKFIQSMKENEDADGL